MGTENRLQKLWNEWLQLSSDSKALEKYKEQLFYLWKCSRFAERVSGRYPDIAQQLLMQAACLGQNSHTMAIQADQLDQHLEAAESMQQAQAVLRKVRALDYLLICWLDLVDGLPMKLVLRRQSDVADLVVKSAEKWLREFSRRDLGYASQTDGDHSEPLIVLALGKLGGCDLNFSSDIDVIFCHADGLSYHGKRTWTVHEYYLQLGRKLVTLLGQTTADGFAFRVDLRLRPFGDSGPLVVSIDQLENYLQAHGREWERYAFIKARLITGSVQAQSELHEIIRPFVYRRYIDFSVIDALRDMKAMIEKQVQRKQLRNNIKLGRGGIREVEFIVQVVQLMRGGHDHTLQVTELLAALKVIEARQYLHSEDVEVLRKAYAYLRRLENHVQMIDEQQLHELPASEAAMQQIAMSMNHAGSVEELLETLSTVQSKVHQVFSALIDVSQQSQTVDSEFDHKIISLEELLENRQEYAQLLKCDQAEEMIVRLGSLLESNAYRQQDNIGRSRLNRFLAQVLPAVADTSQPDETMRRLLPLVRNVLRRSSYLVLLVENPAALNLLVRLAASSPWIAQHLAAYPVLLDDLLSDLGAAEFLTRQQLYDRMIEELGQWSTLNYEEVLDKIRQFKHSQLLRVARASVANKLTVMQVSDQLAWITECVVSGCLDYLRAQFADVIEEFGVIAFGKLGGIEMSYASDLDLVFVYQSQKSAQTLDPSRYFRLAQKLTQMLSLRTVSGKLYEVDVRLRPHGESGPIVSSMDYMRTYYDQDAWTWEYQAIARARVIEGSQPLRDSFSQIRSKALCQSRDKSRLAHEVSAMREKMYANAKPTPANYFDLKKDRGGITDIEFMVQYMVLANAHEFPEVITYTDNFRQLESLEHQRLMSSDKIERLTSIYLQYRSLSHELALQAVDAVVPAEEFKQEREFVINCWEGIFTSAGGDAPTIAQ